MKTRDMQKGKEVYIKADSRNTKMGTIILDDHPFQYLYSEIEDVAISPYYHRVNFDEENECYDFWMLMEPKIELITQVDDPDLRRKIFGKMDLNGRLVSPIYSFSLKQLRNSDAEPDVIYDPTEVFALHQMAIYANKMSIEEARWIENDMIISGLHAYQVDLNYRAEKIFRMKK